MKRELKKLENIVYNNKKKGFRQICSRVAVEGHPNNNVIVYYIKDKGGILPIRTRSISELYDVLNILVPEKILEGLLRR